MIEGKLRKEKEDSRSTELPFCVQEMQRAENGILVYVQRQAFPEELRVLDKATNSSQDVDRSGAPKGVSRTSALYKLDPILQDGLLRVGGRLANADMSYDAKHPVILPNRSTVSDLIIRGFHEEMGHFGRNVRGTGSFMVLLL